MESYQTINATIEPASAREACRPVHCKRKECAESLDFRPLDICRSLGNQDGEPCGWLRVVYLPGYDMKRKRSPGWCMNANCTSFALWNREQTVELCRHTGCDALAPAYRESCGKEVEQPGGGR